MANSFIERQIESVVQEAAGEKAVQLMKDVSRIAAKQGGDSVVKNYQLLGKRALIGLGVALVVVQVTTSAVGFVVSRKNEEQRIERIVRRVIEEERQVAKAAEAAKTVEATADMAASATAQ